MKRERRRIQSEASSGVSTYMSTWSTMSSSSTTSSLSSIADDEETEEQTLSKSSDPDSTDGVETNNEACQNGLTILSYFPVKLSDSTKIVWSYFVINKILCFYLPPLTKKTSILEEALIKLLEFGQEKLFCVQASVLIHNDHHDKDPLIRMFTFMGFCVGQTNGLPVKLRSYCHDYVIMISDC